MVDVQSALQDDSVDPAEMERTALQVRRTGPRIEVAMCKLLTFHF